MRRIITIEDLHEDIAEIVSAKMGVLPNGWDTVSPYRLIKESYNAVEATRQHAAESLAEQLFNARAKADISQRNLAKLCNVESRALSILESCRRLGMIDSWARIAQALDTEFIVNANTISPEVQARLYPRAYWPKKLTEHSKVKE